MAQTIVSALLKSLSIQGIIAQCHFSITVRLSKQPVYPRKDIPSRPLIILLALSKVFIIAIIIILCYMTNQNEICSTNGPVLCAPAQDFPPSTNRPAGNESQLRRPLHHNTSTSCQGMTTARVDKQSRYKTKLDRIEYSLTRTIGSCIRCSIQRKRVHFLICSMHASLIIIYSAHRTQTILKGPVPHAPH